MADLNRKWNVVIRSKGENLDMLTDALYSVAAQTYGNRSVLLILHNASKEATNDISKLTKKFAPILEIEIGEVKGNEGLRGIPLNKALEISDGQYLSFLDYDDVYYPNFGEILIDEIENSNHNFVYGNSIQVNQVRVDNALGERYFYSNNKYKIFGEDFNRVMIVMDNFIPFNTFIIKKELVGDLGFDEKLLVLEDWDFLTQLSFKDSFNPKYIDTHVSEYRIRNDNTNSHNNSPEVQKNWEDSREYIRNKNSSKQVTYSLEEVYKLSNDLLRYKNSTAILSLEKSILERELSLYKRGPIFILIKILNRFPKVKQFIKRFR